MPKSDKWKPLMRKITTSSLLCYFSINFYVKTWLKQKDTFFIQTFSIETMQSNANRNQSNQSKKSLENLIDSIAVRLIRSIENQSND